MPRISMQLILSGECSRLEPLLSHLSEKAWETNTTGAFVAKYFINIARPAYNEIRGVESGGATADLGYYVSFANENGAALPWLQTLDSLAVNGPHAVVIAPVVTRIEMLRIGRTYELCITRHRPVGSAALGRETDDSRFLQEVAAHCGAVVVQ